MPDFTDPAELAAATERSRFEFLQMDLSLCFTFLDLFKTEREFGDFQAAERLVTRAEKGYATIARFLQGVNDPGHREEIEVKLAQLRARLDAVKEERGS